MGHGRPEAVSLAPYPLVNADNSQWPIVLVSASVALEMTKDGVFASGKAEPTGEVFSRPTACPMSQQADNLDTAQRPLSS